MPYKSNNIWEGGICLFDSHTNSVEQITTFTSYLWPWEVATTKDKVDYFICHCQFCKFSILAISSDKKSLEIFDLNTRQINRGNITKANRLV